jgi:fermentation-respiration switch protein FrsA (DUF1100 family)
MKDSFAKLFAWYGTRPRPSTHRQVPSHLGLSYKNVSFLSAHSDRVRLSGWLIPARNPIGVVILCHGHGSTRSKMLRKAVMLNRYHFTTLLFDFRANGGSDGEYGTLGYRETEDVLGAVAYLDSRLDTCSLPVMALGESMGGAAVICAAARCERICAVVSEATFATLDDALMRRVKLCFGPFAPSVAESCSRIGEQDFGLKLSDVSPERDIAAISPRPILLIQDSLDVLCTRQESERLFNAAREPKERWIVPAAPHTYAFTVAPGEYAHRVSKFLTSAAENAATPVPSLKLS